MPVLRVSYMLLQQLNITDFGTKYVHEALPMLQTREFPLQ